MGAPQIVFLDQPLNWVPTILNLLQFILLAALTYYIFRRNTGQKVRERRADWYQKLVVDGAVPVLIKFVDKSCDELRVSARKISEMKANNAHHTEIDAFVTDTAVKTFKDSLGRAQRYLCAQTRIFDAKLEQLMANRFMQLEDDVTNWFNKEVHSEPDAARVDLTNLLIQCQTEIVNALIECEFSKWG